MGLVFSEETAVEVAGPSFGQGQVGVLNSCIDEASKITDQAARFALLDGINHRYRAKTYRDAVKAWLGNGHMSQSQVNDMAKALARIRHNPRTPRAKAFRYQWP